MKKLILIFFLLSPALVSAQSVGLGQIAFVQFSLNGTEVQAACYKSRAGDYLEKRGRFVRYAKQLKALRNKRKRKPSRRVKAKIRLVKSKNRIASPLCGAGKTMLNDFFFTNGDATPLALTQWQIPAGIIPNFNTGFEIYQRYCTGCHGPRPKDTFPQQRQAVERPPMFYSSDILSDLDLANAFSYLKTFSSLS